MLHRFPLPQNRAQFPADPSGFAGLRRRQPRAFAAPFEVWILA
jgi:hypothetical protein